MMRLMTRYYGWYANRPRGRRRQAATETVGAPVDGAIIVAEPVSLPLREARCRWAELLRRIYEVDPLTCPACGGAMRILAFLTARAVIDQILDHLRRTRTEARGPPSTQGPARRAGSWAARRSEVRA